MNDAPRGKLPFPLLNVMLRRAWCRGYCEMWNRERDFCSRRVGDSLCTSRRPDRQIVVFVAEDPAKRARPLPPGFVEETADAKPT